ncbi:MAG: thiol protease/hemagglutinin PrtT, partial [Saprospiraceae bacterium]
AKGFFQQKSGKPGPEMQQITVATRRSNSPDYYIFAPATGAGYVLIAATKASMPVLGYSLNQPFPSNDVPDGMQFLLQWYADQLEYLQTNRVAATPQIAAEWKNGGLSQAENSAPVAPLLQTLWGQDGPYNGKCPKNSSNVAALTGCVATAMAQLMRYWNYPSQATATSNICLTDNNPFDMNSDVSGTWCTWAGGGYDWSQMLDEYTNTSPQGSRDQVAKLMFDCGIGAQMDYGTNVSNATANTAAYAMDTWFGYLDCPIYLKDELSSDWKYILINNLNAGHPMYYEGDNRPYAGGPGSGHAWVVDGYDGGNCFHMNWGWNGASNDYFLLTDLNPASITSTLNNHHHMFVPVPQGFCSIGETLTGDQSNRQVGAAHWIHSNATINPGAITAFHAGNEIVLTDSFVAYAGADFHAYIQGCDYGFSGAEETDRSSVRPASAHIQTSSEMTVAPNPFSGSTLVTFTLANEQEVAMQLFDALGKLVATPMVAQIQSVGEHQFTLMADDLPSGLYFLVLRTGAERMSKKLIITR